MLTVCIGGDFNTDLSRDTCQTDSLKAFINDYDMHCCSTDPISDITHTFESKINGRKTFIDNFLVSSNLKNKLTGCNVYDSVNNVSDHLAINCRLNFDLSYVNPTKDKTDGCHPSWNRASDLDLEKYKELLNNYLMDIPLPEALIFCSDLNCKSHNVEIGNFHNSIIKALVMACDNSIPVGHPKKGNCKSITGWNEYVEKYFQSALLWHKIWVENDRPSNGIISNIRRATRAKYHKVRKDVIANEGIILSNALIQSSTSEPIDVFWKKV